MGLEIAATAQQLVVTNPAAGDPRSEGDDHLRMLKTVLKNDAQSDSRIAAYAATPVAANATTTPIWGGGSNSVVLLSGAAVTFTGFPAAPYAGASCQIVMNAAHSITAGANMLIDGINSGRTILLAANDTVEVLALTTTLFKLKVNYAGAVPAFHATLRGANQSITSSVVTKILFNTEESDTAACYDPVTGRHTPNSSGFYTYTVNAACSATTSLSASGCYIHKNGSISSLDYRTIDGTQYVSVTETFWMNGTTDYVEGYAGIVGVGPVVLFGSYTNFSGCLVAR